MMFPESNDVAETDPTRLIRTELDKGDLSAGTSTRPPFWVVSAKMALPSAAASAADRPRSISSAVASVSR